MTRMLRRSGVEPRPGPQLVPVQETGDVELLRSLSIACEL